jgi:hypothetical protein
MVRRGVCSRVPTRPRPGDFRLAHRRRVRSAIAAAAGGTVATWIPLLHPDLSPVELIWNVRLHGGTQSDDGEFQRLLVNIQCVPVNTVAAEFS